MRKTHVKNMLYAILHDAQKALDDNQSTLQVFNNMKKRINRIETFEEKQYGRLIW